MPDSISLNGEWQAHPTPLSAEGTSGLAQLADASDWLPAEVPGEIHLDLVRAGKMQEPEISDNAQSCRWPEEHAWWYRTAFELSDDFLHHERKQLVFEAIDFYGQVFLNGTQVGDSKNGYVPAVFDVGDALRAGTNELVVRVTSGMERIPDEEGGIYSGIYKGRNGRARRHIRKPHYTFGWDWTDPLPNIGIWRSVHLEGRSGAVIDQCRLDTVMENGEVRLEGVAVLENLSGSTERACVLDLTVEPPEGNSIVQRHECPLPPGLSEIPLSIPVPNPQLWWPNGMGEQPLYAVTVRLASVSPSNCPADGPPSPLEGETSASRPTDHLRFTTGLRTIAIDCSPLPDGERFCITVNGESVFCRGGNWEPPDMIPARIAPDRYETLVAEARDAHFTMFRVNGVGIYDDDAFFDACDRAGILVWQDFMFACSEYPDYEEEFRTAIRDEATAVIRRLRNHPSLAVWCGCNECHDGMYKRWELHEGAVETDYYGWDDKAGTLLYDELLPALCRELDPCRPYRESSPYGGPFPNSETHGTCHWWRTFFMSDDVQRRIRPEVFEDCHARFVAEYGIVGPCHIDSVREYLKPDELSPESLAWKLHTNTFERGTLEEAIRYHYRDPQGMTVEEFSLYGQLYQALMHEHAMLALRFRTCDPEAPCSGALVWSYNDCWGETGWSIVDHYLRRKASYYALRRACLPVKVIVRPRGNGLATRVVNDTRQAYAATLLRGWFRVDGTDREVTETQVELPANTMTEIGSDPLSADKQSGDWVYGAVLSSSMRLAGVSPSNLPADCAAFPLEGEASASRLPPEGEAFPPNQCTWLPVVFRELAVSPPDIHVRTLPWRELPARDLSADKKTSRMLVPRQRELEITSPVFCHAVHVDDGGHELLSDNYFDLLPGIPYRVTVTGGNGDIELRTV